MARTDQDYALLARQYGAVGSAGPTSTTQPVATAAGPSNDTADLRQRILDWYKQYLNGRVPSEAEIQSHLKNPGGAAAIEDTIKNSAEAKAAPAARTEAAPSTWTDNNAPYGVTLAGFSPQDHTNLSLADLGTPGKAEKYAVYNHLLTNQIQPTKDWAPAAADALNKKYNTTVYKAIDGETLGFGNEYVHSAPNGYGMQRGTFNPNATGEFFWGASDGGPSTGTTGPGTSGATGPSTSGPVTSGLSLAPKQSVARSSLANLTQLDPGVLRSGNQFFVADPTNKDNVIYAADNEGAFGIGGKTPTAAFSTPTSDGTASATAAPATTVMMLAPDGTKKAVNAADVAHYKGLGATVIA